LPEAAGVVAIVVVIAIVAEAVAGVLPRAVAGVLLVVLLLGARVAVAAGEPLVSQAPSRGMATAANSRRAYILRFTMRFLSCSFGTSY